MLMCATKMSYLGLQEVGNADSAGEPVLGKPSGDEKILTQGVGRYHNWGNHQLLSRESDRDSQTLSVHNLLNLSNEQEGTSSEDVRRGSRVITEDKGIRKSDLGEGSEQGACYVTGEMAEVNEKLQKQRNRSIASLMRAAITVEKNEHDLGQVYQEKVGSIIELRNQLEDKLESWPSIRRASESDSDRSPVDLEDASNRIKNIHLDQINAENLDSLKNVAKTLQTAVKELDELKKKENINQEVKKRSVRLPSIDILASNIGERQPHAALQSYRFPNKDFGTNVQHIAAEHVGGQFPVQFHSPTYQTSWYVQGPPYSAGPHDHFTMPIIEAPLRMPHRGSAPDPLIHHTPYMNVPTTKVVTNNDTHGHSHGVSAESPTMVFQSSSGPSNLVTFDKSFNKHRFKNKTIKPPSKMKRSASDNLITENCKTSNHRLVLSDTVRKIEQSTTSCVHCGEASTPEWRRGPYGNRTLCNACGLFYRKLVKRFGNKDANLFMRYRKRINPEDRRVPSALEIPDHLRQELENDRNLDQEFFTINRSQFLNP